MSERVKEITAQACQWALNECQKNSQPGVDNTGMVVNYAMAKQFELILQEVFRVMQRRYMGDNNREDMEVRRCIDDIKRNFGVE